MTPPSKLSPEKIAEIRKTYADAKGSMSFVKLGKLFNISTSAALKIVNSGMN